MGGSPSEEDVMSRVNIGQFHYYSFFWRATKVVIYVEYFYCAIYYPRMVKYISLCLKCDEFLRIFGDREKLDIL